MKIIAYAALWFWTASVLAAADFVLVPERSSVDFEVGNLLVSSVTGSFSVFMGSFAVQGDKLSGLRGDVASSSVDTQNSRRDEHLRSDDFFDVEKYPKMYLKMVEASGDRIKANLTIKEITRPVLLRYRLEEAEPDMQERRHVKLNIDGQVDRQAFGITYGWLIGDTVDIHVALEGVEHHSGMH